MNIYYICQILFIDEKSTTLIFIKWWGCETFWLCLWLIWNKIKTWRTVTTWLLKDFHGICEAIIILIEAKSSVVIWQPWNVPWYTFAFLFSKFDGALIFTTAFRVQSWHIDFFVFMWQQTISDLRIQVIESLRCSNLGLSIYQEVKSFVLEEEKNVRHEFKKNVPPLMKIEHKSTWLATIR